MVVKQLITTAFATAYARYPEIHEAWIKLSFQFGSKLPRSLLMESIQKAGRLDMVLRSMEAEGLSPNGFLHEQPFLTELWIGHTYEIFRMLTSDKKVTAAANAEMKAIARDLKLLRIPLEKYEIADDKHLKEPLRMQAVPMGQAPTSLSEYKKGDTIIMPMGVSENGSMMWQVIDIRNDNATFWLERRQLADRILALRA